MSSGIPETVRKRLVKAVPKFKKVLEEASAADSNEHDTVTIVTDMLEEVFGFDKYKDVTREFSTRGKDKCDLAVIIDRNPQYLIEVKAIGKVLKKEHLTQVVNYVASTEGVKWAVLTNGIEWQIHHVTWSKKTNKTEHKSLFEFDFTKINLKQQKQQELLFLLCKRGVKKDLISDFYEQKKSTNPYLLGALLLTDPVMNSVRKELKKLRPDINVSKEELRDIIQGDVLRRQWLEGDEAQEAKKQITKLARKQERMKKQKQADKISTPQVDQDSDAT